VRTNLTLHLPICNFTVEFFVLLGTKWTGSACPRDGEHWQCLQLQCSILILVSNHNYFIYNFRLVKIEIRQFPVNKDVRNI
jgi:hypothetical protein